MFYYLHNFIIYQSSISYAVYYGITCSSFGTFISCIVETTNTTLIQETIESEIESSHTYLKITIQGDGAGATLNISLPDNINSLVVYNNVDTPVFIETSLLIAM